MDSGKHFLLFFSIPLYSEIHKWWAGYLESLGDCDQAMQFYEMARDFPSLVRMLCSNGNFERATEIVEESGSQAAAYLLASRLRMEKEVCMFTSNSYGAHFNVYLVMMNTGHTECYTLLYQGPVLQSCHSTSQGMISYMRACYCKISNLCVCCCHSKRNMAWTMS